MKHPKCPLIFQIRRKLICRRPHLHCEVNHAEEIKLWDIRRTGRWEGKALFFHCLIRPSTSSHHAFQPQMSKTAPRSSPGQWEELGGRRWKGLKQSPCAPGRLQPWRRPHPIHLIHWVNGHSLFFYIWANGVFITSDSTPSLKRLQSNMWAAGNKVHFNDCTKQLTTEPETVPQPRPHLYRTWK